MVSFLLALSRWAFCHFITKTDYTAVSLTLFGFLRDILSLDFVLIFRVWQKAFKMPAENALLLSFHLLFLFSFYSDLQRLPMIAPGALPVFTRKVPSFRMKVRSAFINFWDHRSTGIHCCAFNPHPILSMAFMRNRTFPLSSLSFGFVAGASWLKCMESFSNASNSPLFSSLTSYMVDASGIPLISILILKSCFVAVTILQLRNVQYYAVQLVGDKLYYITVTIF